MMCVGIGGYYSGLCDGNCVDCPYVPDEGEIIDGEVQNNGDLEQ